MKIVIFSETYKPVLNGVVQSIIALKNNLKKRGHKIYIFTSGKKIKEDGVYYCPKIEINQGYGPVFPYFKEQNILKNADIYHTHQPGILGLYALHKAKQYNKPIIFTKHTQYLSFLHYVPLLKGKSRTLIIKYLQWYMSHCNNVVLPSMSLKNKIIKTYKVNKEKIRIIPNGINLKKKFSNASINRIKKKYFLFNKNILINIGRMGKEKNLYFLIDCFKIINRKNKDIVLFLIGGGPEYYNLKDYIQKSNLEKFIFLTGYIPNKEVYNYLKLSDIYISSSKSESHPITILEAMSVGCIPITLKTYGFIDTIDNDINGILIDKEKKSYFASAILNLLKNKNKYNAMRKMAIKKSRKFSIKNTADNYLRLYNELIRSKSI